MNKILRALSLGAAILMCPAAHCFAQLNDPYPYTRNGTNNYTVWVTIYDLGKTRQLDWGCVNPIGSRKWTSGNYAFGSFYYIRAEVMTGNDCKGQKVCDTTVQFNPQDPDISRHDVKPVNVHWQLNYDGSKCHWSQNKDAAVVNVGVKVPTLAACSSKYPHTEFKPGGMVNHVATLDGPYLKGCRECSYSSPYPPPPVPTGCGPGTFLGACPEPQPRDRLTARCDAGAFVGYVNASLDGASQCKPGSIRNELGRLVCSK